MRPHGIVSLVLAVTCGGAVAAFLLGGCAERLTEPGDSLTREEAVLLILSRLGGESDWFDVEAVDSAGESGEDALARSGFWRREPDWPYQRDHQVDVGGDMAYVTLNWVATGVCHVFGNEAPVQDYPRALTDVSRRLAVFRQHPDSTQHPGGWVLEEVSGVRMESRPEPTVRIDSVAIRAIDSRVQVVFRDPLALWPLERLPAFETGDEVIIDVFTSGAPARVFVRTGPGGVRATRHEISEAPGTRHRFAGSWSAPGRPGIHQISVDAINRESLGVDPTSLYRYDSSRWLLPYRVGDVDEIR